jgi:hypothetical protein
LFHVFSFCGFKEGDDTGDPKTSYTKLIAVHAGLESSKPVEPQLQSLRNRDVTAPRVEPLAGRKNVWNTPPVSFYSLACLKIYFGFKLR